MCTVALLLALASLLTGCGAGVRPVPRVILVHGAFEDASSWDAVAGRLRRDGIVINAPELPLKSLPSDADRVLAEINRIPGPVLLVGHSWGGTVITEAAADEQVVGLVYVAATAPTAGQSTKAQMASDEAAPASQEIASGRDGTLRISEAGMCNALAPGLATGECIRLTRSQRPIRATAFDAAVTHSRAHIPVTYVLASEDQAIPPTLQKRIATNLNAQLVEVRAGHALHRTHAEDVAGAILRSLN